MGGFIRFGWRISLYDSWFETNTEISCDTVVITCHYHDNMFLKWKQTPWKTHLPWVKLGLQSWTVRSFREFQILEFYKNPNPNATLCAAYYSPWQLYIIIHIHISNWYEGMIDCWHELLLESSDRHMTGVGMLSGYWNGQGGFHG